MKSNLFLIFIVLFLTTGCNSEENTRVNGKVSFTDADSIYKRGYSDGHKDMRRNVGNIRAQNDSSYQLGYEKGFLEGISASKSSFQFNPLEKVQVSLFNNFNKIDSIEATNVYCNLYSNDGILSFDYNKKAWFIDTLNALPYQVKKKFDFINKPGYRRAAYSYLIDSKNKYGPELALLAFSNEGATGAWNAVVDSAKNIAYNGLGYYYDRFDYDFNNIWLGQRAGFSRIDRTTQYKDDYVLLPFYDSKGNVFINDNIAIIASDYVGIQLFDIRNNSIEFLSVENILVKAGVIKLQSDMDIAPVFTNICENNGIIYFSYRSDEQENTYILILDYKRKSWKSVLFDGYNKCAILSFDKNKLWFGGREIQPGDDQPTYYSGGVGYYDILQNEITFVINPPTDYMATDFAHDAKGTYVHMIQESKKGIFFISDNRAVIDSVSQVDYKKYKNMFTQLTEDVSRKESPRFKSVFAGKRFTPKIVLRKTHKVKRVESFYRD